MQNTLRKVGTMLVVLLLLCLVWHATAQACPTCKDGMAGNDPARMAMVRGYFYSIIFMMSMPFLIVAGLGAYFYLLVRRARREAATVVVPTVASNRAHVHAGPSWLGHGA